MSDYLTEQEQIQELKRWFKQYGPSILLGIIIAILASTIWSYYQNHRNNTLIHASAIYDEMLTLRAQNNRESALVQANKLLSHYPQSPYAQMAAFMLARDAVLKKNYPEAIKQLTWVTEHTKNPGIKEIASIRKARVFISDHQPNSALDILKKLNNKNFIGLVNETRGDAYLAMNDSVSARDAYQLALKEIPNAEVNRPILEMKYANLAKSSLPKDLTHV